MSSVFNLLEMTLHHESYIIPQDIWRRWWWLMFYGHFCAHGRLNGPKVMKRRQTRNNLQIYLRRDSNTGGSDLWSNMYSTARPRRLYLNVKSMWAFLLWIHMRNFMLNPHQDFMLNQRCNFHIEFKKAEYYIF